MAQDHHFSLKIWWTQKYYFITKRVVQLLLQMVPEDRGILRQGLTSCHISEQCKEFSSENIVAVLEWPDNSLDSIHLIYGNCQKRLYNEIILLFLESIHLLFQLIWMRYRCWNQKTLILSEYRSFVPFKATIVSKWEPMRI